MDVPLPVGIGYGLMNRCVSLTTISVKKCVLDKASPDAVSLVTAMVAIGRLVLMCPKMTAITILQLLVAPEVNLYAYINKNLYLKGLFFVNSFNRYFSLLGQYILLESPIHEGGFCSSLQKLSGEKDCIDAAKSISYPWGYSWDGRKDFPGCYLATDGRDTVYYNKSPKQCKSISCLPRISKQYKAICKNDKISECIISNYCCIIYMSSSMEIQLCF